MILEEIRKRRLQSMNRFSYRLGWLGFRALYRFYFRWHVFNAERVPQTGPVILASNHASFLDPPLVGSGLQRSINYLARESLFRFPGIGALLRSWKAVPVDRDGGGAAGSEGHSGPVAGRRRRSFCFPKARGRRMATCSRRVPASVWR